MPAPGVDAVYPGPYMAWFPDPSTESISETLEIIDDIVEDEGPFDGIMGFSQVRLNYTQTQGLMETRVAQWLRVLFFEDN